MVKNKVKRIGRVKGTPNKMTVARLAGVRQLVTPDQMPVKLMVHNMLHYQQLAEEADRKLLELPDNDTFNDMEPRERFEFLMARVIKALNLRDKAEGCAVDAAPYLHHRLTAVSATVSNHDLSRLTIEELQQLQHIIERVAEDPLIGQTVNHYLRSKIAELDKPQIEAARKGLLAFTTYTFPGYAAGKMHKLIADALDKFLAQVEAKKSPRLMITMPPRHGKSELVSRRFPAYAMGHYPNLNFIAASYAADLSAQFNRDVQRIIDDPLFGNVFPKVSLYGKAVRSSSTGVYLRNSDLFEIVGYKGIYKSAGIGVGITGRGADILVIDDPIKDSEESRSETVRENVWEWYTYVAYPRLSAGAGVILCMTRWNQDDLVGRLLEKMKSGGEKWKVLSLPAEAEDANDLLGRKVGEALDPVRYPIATLRNIKNGIGEWAWASLYQQRPVPREGGMFKLDWFTGHYIDDTEVKARDDIHWVRHWDLAATKKSTAAKTAGVKIGRYPDGRFVVGHAVTVQEEGPAVRRLIIATASKDGRQVDISLPQDPGQAGKVQASDMINMLAGYNVHAEPETGSKELRAEPFAAQCAAGNVDIVRGEWTEKFLDELTMFPGGTFKDQVDASSGAFSRLTAGAKAEQWIKYYEGLAKRAMNGDEMVKPPDRELPLHKRNQPPPVEPDNVIAETYNRITGKALETKTVCYWCDEVVGNNRATDGENIFHTSCYTAMLRAPKQARAS